MTHFAKCLDGKVVSVIVAEPEFFDTFIDSSPGVWVQTSYNTRGGVHYGPDGEPDGGVPMRGNFAGLGYIYDSINDVFYPTQPYPSWTISGPTWTWKAPYEQPDDGKIYRWDEATVSWVDHHN